MQQKSILQNYESLIAKAKPALINFPWENKEAYAAWLAQTLYFVEKSTRIIALAGSLFPIERNDLHLRFLEHCREEKGHEKLLVKDLNNLGFQRSDLTVYASTKALYQSQYYWIQQVSPISLFGYILFLEGLAAEFGSLALKKCETSHGAKPCSFLKVHTAEDTEHVESALALVQNVNPEQCAWINENMNLSASLYLDFLEKIQQTLKLENQKYDRVS